MHHIRQIYNRPLDTPDKRSRDLALFQLPHHFFLIRKENTIKRPSGSDTLVTTLIVHITVGNFVLMMTYSLAFCLVSSGAFVKYFWAA